MSPSLSCVHCFNCSGTALPRVCKASIPRVAKMVWNTRPTAIAIDIDRIGRPIAQRLVRTVVVVERDVLRQTERQLGNRGLSLQVHVLMFNAAPQPLDKDVVQRPPASVHADGNAIPLEPARERRARKLRSLVGVDDLRLVVQL